MPLRVIFRDPIKQLVVCYHDYAPPEGRCPVCGLPVFAGLPTGAVRFWEPTPDPRLWAPLAEIDSEEARRAFARPYSWREDNVGKIAGYLWDRIVVPLLVKARLWPSGNE